MAQTIILSWCPGMSDAKTRTIFQRSLGSYRIASSLKNAGYSVAILDAIGYLTDGQIEKFLNEHIDKDTLWIGFNSTFISFNDTRFYEIINNVYDYVKRKNTKIKILQGGAITPFIVAFNINDKVDHYILGNADISIVEVTNLIKNNELVSKVITSSFFKEPDVNNISTDWSNDNFNILDKESIPIEFGRGCIFKCKFCAYDLTGKKKGTYIRDLSQIRDELILTWEKYGTTNFYFIDDTFNDDNEKMESISRMFSTLPFKPNFSCFLRIDLLNKFPHQIDLLKNMGLAGVFFGIESFHRDSLKSIGKGLNPDKVKERLYYVRDEWKNSVNIGINFILGLPYDNIKYFEELLDWSMQKTCPVQHINFVPLYLHATGKDNKILQPYMSEFSINAEKHGYSFDNDYKWYSKTNNLNYKICNEISNEYNAIRNSHNKYADFNVTTIKNLGISNQDIFNLTIDDLNKKYNMNNLASSRFKQYTEKLGL